MVFPGGARAGVVVPGHAPGSRELGALDPSHLAGGIHAVLLSGGSAFGLATADGAMRALAARGIGFSVGDHVVPIVPAAILFDLAVAAARPDADAGAAAAERALAPADGPLGCGAVGAGAGGRVGKAWGATAPGGFGEEVLPVGGHLVGVGVAVNAYGGIRDPSTGAWVAGAPGGPGAAPTAPWMENTTLAVVVTDAPLTGPQCRVVAQMASAGLARTIDPAFTPFDGDIVFAAATGEGGEVDPMTLLDLGRAAAVALGAAVVRAVQRQRDGV